jgi:hypothetical protein
MMQVPLTAFLCVLIALHAVAAEQGPPVACVQLPHDLSEREQTVISGGVKRLSNAIDCPLDILHGTTFGPDLLQRYRLIVRIRLNRSCSEPLDAYRLRSILEPSATVVVVSSVNARGVLFACHDLSHRIVKRDSLSNINLTRRPLVRRRLALLPPSTRFGKHFQPELFWRSLEELPRLGMNGVLVVPAKTHGVPAGMTSLPLRFLNGEFRSIQPELGEWRSVFQRIEAAGQDIFLLCSPLIPPEFSAEQVRDHYQGNTTLTEYDVKAEATLRAFLCELFDELPEVDGVVFHSLELGELWDGAVSMFPARDVSAACNAFNAYLTALESVCRERGKTPCFWNHVGGLDGATLVRIRQEIVRHAEVVNLEDAYWPNAGWPMVPLLGYLPEPWRTEIHQRGRFGMFLEHTDGEYYGGGILPVVYSRPAYEAAHEAVRRGAEITVLRLNEHDETGLGTLFSSTAVLFEMAASQLWSPSRSPEYVWSDVCTRLYGENAASVVEKALRRSKSILLDGFTLGGFPLLDHEGVNPCHWLRGNMAFRLFAMPGTPVVDGSHARLRGEEFTAWQSGSKATSMEVFQARNAKARAQAEAGLGEILSAQSLLEPADFCRLRDTFADAIVVLDTLRLLGQAAHAANLLRNDSDEGTDSDSQLSEALQKLEARADWIEATKGPSFLRVHEFVVIRSKDVTYAGPSLAESLRIIHEDYGRILTKGK